jgi:anti-sigma factor RsiW
MKNDSPVTEAELHAYLDGQLDAARRAAVEAWLVINPAEAERVRAYARQNEQLHALFDNTLDEPVPEALRRKPALRRPSPMRFAALLAAAVMGGVLGWALRGEEPLVITTNLPQQAALAHVVYTPEVLHPVEVSAREEEHLVSWLSKRLGAPVRAPRLSDAGYELVGGRLLPGEAGPAAQFMYQDVRGNRLTLYVRTTAENNHETAFRYAQENKVGVFYWVDGTFGYALSGELERPQLLRVAENVYRSLNP